MNLPVEFQNRMKEYLADEYDEFICSFNANEVKAFHINESRVNMDTFLNNTDIKYTPINNISNGFYYDDSKIGSTIEHHAGILYSQDPSAMEPVNTFSKLLNGSEIVLDLCSAPGGKSSQLANILSKNGGFLVSNEPNQARNKILVSNIERMGYTNVLVTKMLPEELATYYNSYFDAIVVDAPCSGEGMFRKYPESINEWSLNNIQMCHDRQIDILNSAISMLKPGGYLLYSTCTYAQEEDEEIAKYLSNQGFTIHELTSPLGIKCYPHKQKGEGQYYCIFVKNGELSFKNNYVKPCFNKLSNNMKKQVIDLVGHVFTDYPVDFYNINDRIIILPNEYIKIPAHNIALAGVIAGEFVKNRFIPHHHLFHAYGQLFDNKIDLTSNKDILYKYLHGEEITYNNISNGYGVITYMGAPVGGFKASNGRLKNHYPKGLRN